MWILWCFCFWTKSSGAQGLFLTLCLVFSFSSALGSLWCQLESGHKYGLPYWPLHNWGVIKKKSKHPWDASGVKMDYTASKYESASSMPSATYMHPAGSWQLCTVWSLVHSWWVWTSQIKLQINVQFMGSITTVRCVSTAIRQLQLPHQYLYDLHSKKQHKTTNNASGLCWVLWLNAQTTVLSHPITFDL